MNKNLVRDDKSGQAASHKIKEAISSCDFVNKNDAIYINIHYIAIQDFSYRAKTIEFYSTDTVCPVKFSNISFQRLRNESVFQIKGNQAQALG